MTSIPAAPADIRSEWLSKVLSSDGASVVINRAEVTPVGTGQTGATYRVAVSYDERPAGMPDTFVVKLPSEDPAVRERVSLGYRAEHAFYTLAADTLAMPMPACYHCEIAREGADFVLVLEDLAPAEQGDQIAGCGPKEARLAVEALAGLHGPRWCDPDWLTFPGVTMPRADADFASGLGDIVRMATDITVDKLGDRISDSDRATLNEATDLTRAWLLLEPDRFCLLHGDYRLDNLLFDPDRTRVAVVDWQTLAVGLPARDLSYFLATSLQPGVRADSERDLVGHYHRALCGHGVSGYDEQQCWLDYRLGMLQVPLITMLGFAFAAATDRGDQMVLTMLERGARAIRDLDTLGVIRSLVS